ncbi:MAG: TetR/AcrR family transcriptional regulator [Huintestinicola sp.]
MANYTEKAIFNAFEELLNEKPFDKITVSAIVAKSEVSANTFYYHFQDIFDLLDRWLDKKKNHYLQQTQDASCWTVKLKVFLHAMQDNPTLIYHISNSITRERLERYVFTSAEGQFYEYIEKQTADLNITDETRKLMTSFFCYSLLGYLLKFLWINMKVDVDTSVDNLSTFFYGALESIVHEQEGQ